MVLEQIVKDILKEEYSRIKTQVAWDGMFDETAKKIVKKIKEEIVK
jgi:AAA+ ATPase superfamily predicted ATPase|tara:strand:+ start:293 stop:430 length:138 start_codon:yes stop_codon:yes gene_type:complete